MTTLDTRALASDRVFGANLGSAITAVVGRLAAWNDARVTRHALSKLTDRELDDIGLCRGDIDEIR
jgi:uncharacterized protein YjiS (DUF1127 family)